MHQTQYQHCSHVRSNCQLSIIPWATHHAMVTLSGHLASHSIPIYHKMNIKGFPMQMRAHQLQKHAKEKTDCTQRSLGTKA